MIFPRDELIASLVRLQDHCGKLQELVIDLQVENSRLKAKIAGARGCHFCKGQGVYRYLGDGWQFGKCPDCSGRGVTFREREQDESTSE